MTSMSTLYKIFPVKNNASTPPIDSSKPHKSDKVIDIIIDKYKDHPSTELIEVNLPEPNTFTFKKHPKTTLLK